MVDVHTAANEPRNEGRPLAEPVGFFLFSKVQLG